MRDNRGAVDEVEDREHVIRVPDIIVVSDGARVLAVGNEGIVDQGVGFNIVKEDAHSVGLAGTQRRLLRVSFVVVRIGKIVRNVGDVLVNGAIAHPEVLNIAVVDHVITQRRVLSQRSAVDIGIAVAFVEVEITFRVHMDITEDDILLFDGEPGNAKILRGLLDVCR